MHDAHRINVAAYRAALFFGVAGLLAIGNSLLLGSTIENRAAFLGLGILDLVMAALVWGLPWARWPVRALFALVPISLVIIGLFTLVRAQTPSTYPVFFILVFIWVGLSLPPRAALWCAPLTIVAYVLPLWLAHYPAPVLVSATVVVPVCVLVGEVIARALHRLHATQDALEQQVAERTAQLEATNIAFQNELAERKQLETQLLQAHRLEGIGRLAGGIAHDFNNILMGIGGYADLIAIDLPGNHSSHHDIGEIQKAVTRATTLTRQLLTFARQQTIEPQALNLNDLIDKLHNLLQRVLGENIELMLQPAPQLGWVSADAGQITQVILNLAINARDAMPTGGTLTIETRNVHVERAYVCVTVRDTGSGMDPIVQEHAFEPFFTTKAITHGTGLGLATCYGIIKQHSGTISITSECGQGTAVTITLPHMETLTLPNATPTSPR